MVLPNDANLLGNVLGGRVLHWIDIAAAICAQRHCRRQVVTASMDRVDFLHPIKVGQLMILKASVNFVSNTSMEVGVQVRSEVPMSGEGRQTATAYTTFVALDDLGHPTRVPPILAETEVEKRRLSDGKERRRVRLEEIARRRGRKVAKK